jgi:hypothetical protein
MLASITDRDPNTRMHICQKYAFYMIKMLFFVSVSQITKD